MDSMNKMIIHPDIEPGVIDNALIERSILDQGPKGEAGRLFAEEGVHLDETVVLRLEFEKIIRIDHLWMLKSLTKLVLAHNLIEKIENLEQLTGLTELDLSFNKITKIENLDLLLNLEVLSLFHNRITKLENLEVLEGTLMIFSIGDNLIEDITEITYMRRFRNLRTLSVKGNPCCEAPDIYYFLKAALPNITYLDYRSIPEQDKEMGVVKFRSELRDFNEIYEVFEKERNTKEAYIAKNKYYALAFVEYLGGAELFESMFEKDPDGTLLLKIGGELIHHFTQYKEQYVEAMTTLVEFGLTAYVERENEVKMFNDVMDAALDSSVNRSKTIVQEFESKKKPMVTQMNELIEQVTSKVSSITDVEARLSSMGEEFDDMLYKLWKSLMTLELQLFEQCEDTRVQFGVNLTEKIGKLLEVSRNAFGQWRELESTWSMSQFDIVSRLLGVKLTLFDDTPELIDVLSDRDVMMNVIAQSNDSHMRFVDEREDTLNTRTNSWKDELLQKNKDNEIKRNRDRILEINYYIDNQREEWEDLQLNLSEAPDAEAVALLADEF